MNSGALAVEHFYRLFTVCVMLRNVKVAGRGMAHNYPQIQLTYMLILAYQFKNNLVSYEMLLNNQSMFNEDMGEITFSVLSRCVLGDNVKCMFSHLDRMYCMIPYVQEVVKDIASDFGSRKNSINWRHTISMQAVEITTTAAYFSNLIRQVESNVYKCYDGTEAGYKNVTKSREHMVDSTLPVVYMCDISLVVGTMVEQLTKNVHGFNVFPYRHIWPEAGVGMFGDDDIKGVNGDHVVDQNDQVQEQEVNDDYDMNEFEQEPVVPLSQIELEMDSDESVAGDDHELDSVVADGHEEEFDMSQPSMSHLNRSWNAWGAVNEENIIPRHRNNRYGRGRNDVIEPGFEDLVRSVERKESRDRG